MYSRVAFLLINAIFIIAPLVFAEDNYTGMVFVEGGTFMMAVTANHNNDLQNVLAITENLSIISTIWNNTPKQLF